MEPNGKLTIRTTETGRKLYIHLYERCMGWNFRRLIFIDEDGTEFIRINGCFTELAWARSRAVYSQIDIE